MKTIATALLAATLTGCALSPIHDDECSGDWPDEARYAHCCIVHDAEYRAGVGTRLASDQRLRQCVVNATGDEALAERGFQWVRTWGGVWWQ